MHQSGASPRHKTARCASLPVLQALCPAAEALLRVLGSQDHVGGLGAGSAAKLVENIALGFMTATRQSLALVETLGPSPAAAFGVICHDAACRTGPAALRRVGAPDVPARVRLSKARKDADIMLVSALRHAGATDGALGQVMAYGGRAVRLGRDAHRRARHHPRRCGRRQTLCGLMQ